MERELRLPGRGPFLFLFLGWDWGLGLSEPCTEREGDQRIFRDKAS